MTMITHGNNFIIEHRNQFSLWLKMFAYSSKVSKFWLLVATNIRPQALGYTITICYDH